MGAEASGDATSTGPVKLADLQRILSNIGSAGILGSVGMNHCLCFIAVFLV